MKKIALLFAAALFLAGCNRIKDERAFFDIMNQMDEGHLTSEQMRSRERELRAAIRENRRILEERVTAARDLARFHQMLGRLYLDNGMYLLAAQEFENALQITNKNPVLFYFAGLAYARYAKSLVDETMQFAKLLLAERYYLKALEYNPNFSRALYAISVLYVFEFDQPDRAILYLERLLETQRSDFEAMFLLANAYVRLGLLDKASAIYDNIIRNTMSTVFRRQAEENKRQLDAWR
ncbi:MAG: tetratricopeptide repeat protein [Spirochaetes bacterium]|nr:tetratricopeptide repeat protein [Spirochaetota bacterium]